MSKKNPLVFMDVSIDGDPFERMIFELFYDRVPKTAENFRALFTGEKGLSSKTGKPLHYKGTFFHRIIKGSMAQAGDLLRSDGKYGESIYGDKFPDELAKVKHDERGLLSMAIADRDTHGSLFGITFKANHHLDRKNIAFGKLVEGIDVLEKIERYGDEEGKPVVTVKIKNCGEHQNENQSSDKKKTSKLKNGKDASLEANSREIRRMRKHKKSSKNTRKRRKYDTSDSDSSSDVETETSESDSESDSDISSDTSSSSDDRRKKRKRSSKRDRYKRAKKRDRKRDRRRKRRDKRSKHRSKRAFGGSSGSESKSESSSDDDIDDVCRQDRKHKNPAHVTADIRSPEDFTLRQKKIDSQDILEREEGEYPKENGRGQTNGIEMETKSGKSADRQPDVVDDHPGKSRSRSLSPRRTLNQSMSISPKRSLSNSLSVSPKRSNSRSPSVGGSPPLVSRGSRSFSRSPIRSGSSRSPLRSVSRSPIRPKKGRSISPVGRHGRSPTSTPPLRSPTPPRISSRRSSRKSASRTPVRSTRRSMSRSSGRGPSRRIVSRSPVRARTRNSHRSYSRSPVGRGRSERSTYADRGRSTSRSPSPDGSPKRIRRGRGFSQRYSYARRYHSPDRSPVRSYRYGSRSDRDRYSSYRRSPRRHRSPLRDRTPRYRSRRSRTRSLSPSRSPIRYRNRRYSRSPVEASRYRASPRVDRRMSPRSRSASLSGSSRSQSLKRDSKEKSVPSSVSPSANKGLVSYVDGSPDSSQG